MGSIRQPGTYPIPYSDLRVLDDIRLAGDMGAVVRTLYVIRRRQDGYAQPGAPQEPADTQPRDKLIIPPPTEEDANFSGTLFARLGPAQDTTTDAVSAVGLVISAYTKSPRPSSCGMNFQLPGAESTFRSSTRCQVVSEGTGTHILTSLAPWGMS